MERLYQKMARRSIVGLALLVTVLAFIAFAYFDRARPPGTPGVVVLQLAFSAEAFRNIIAQWGASGVQAYRVSTLYVDSWFPIAYALLLSSLIAVLTNRPERAVSKPHLVFFSLPFVAMCLDWIENTLHFILLRNPGHIAPLLVWFASLAAAVKWGLIAFSLLAIGYFLVQRIHERVKR